MTSPENTTLITLASLDTNTVSDALDFMGLPGATYGLRPLWNCPKIVGRASTIQLGPKTGTAPTVHLISPVIASGTPIVVAGVTVCEDDYVIADRCGTVFVPAARIDEVLALAQRIASRQDGMVQAVRAGQSVEDVMHDKKFEAIRS